MITNTPSIGSMIPWDKVTLSEGYTFWGKGIETTGNLTDSSGNGADGVKTVSDAVIWANLGWISFRTQAVADESVAIPATAFDFDFQNGESCILSYWMNKNADETFDIPFHNAKADGEEGFKFQAREAGGRYAFVFYSGGTSFQTARATKRISDNVDRHITIALDSVAQTLDLFIDGKADATLQGIDIGAWNTQGTAATTGNKGSTVLRIGGQATSTDEDQIRDVHILKRTGGLPSDIQQVVNKLHGRLFYPLSTEDWS